MNALICLGLLKLFSKLTAAECRNNKCLLGKTAIVTGAGEGIGHELVKALAARGCTVYLSGLVKVPETTMANFRRSTNNPNLHYDVLDLSSFVKVRHYVDSYKKRENRLDILVHNSKILGNPRKITRDNLLQVMQWNHLSPFLMTHLLFDSLKSTPNSRVVFDGNFASHVPTMFHANVMLDNRQKVSNLLENFKSYNNSQMCSCICAKIFADKFKVHGITSNIAYGGLVDYEERKVHNTLMGDHSSVVQMLKVFLDGIIYVYGKTILEGTQTVLHCSQGRNVGTGKFYMDCRSIPMPLTVYFPKLSREVWSLSETIVQLSELEKLK